MESVGSPFHQALAERREEYNARFRLARHRSKSLDANAFLAQLGELGPAVDAAAAHGGDPLEVTDALVDLAFAANGRVSDVLKRLLPELAVFVAQDPQRVAVSMANASHHLGPAATAWAHTMTQFAPRAATVDSLLDIGAVAAWRHGLATLRNAALATARNVAPDVLRDLLGTSDVDALTADPWLRPGQPPGLQIVRRVGRFRGFGGQFARPPEVFTAGQHWYATDGRGTWRVHADRFGAGLKRVDGIQADRPAPTLTLSGQGEVRFRDQSLTVTELAGATSWASLDNTLAATTPWTHAITFVAWS